MTLLEMLRIHGTVQLDLPDLRGPLLVTTSRERLELSIEDVKFATGGAISLVHELKPEDTARAWSGAPETCEACQ